MGKIADKYAEIEGWDEDKWNSFNWDRPLPKFKDKEISFDAGTPGIEAIDIYDAVNDPDFKKAFDAMSDEDKEDVLIQISNAQPDILDHKKVLAMLDADETPDDPDESSDEPHDEELAGEKTPEEDFMERAAAGEVPATSGVLAGDLTPEEIEMIQMMRAGKQLPKSKELAGETTPEEDEMLKLAGNQTLSDERFKNVTNRLAKNLSKHRW